MLGSNPLLITDRSQGSAPSQKSALNEDVDRTPKKSDQSSNPTGCGLSLDYFDIDKLDLD